MACSPSQARWIHQSVCLPSQDFSMRLCHSGFKTQIANQPKYALPPKCYYTTITTAATTATTNITTITTTATTNNNNNNNDPVEVFYQEGKS
jgi:hypothetical protein